MLRPRQKAWHMRVGIACLACCLTLVVALKYADMPYRLDDGVRDAMIRLSVRRTPETRIAIIDIDEQSLAEMGPWPWPRNRVADLLETLLIDAQARAIGLDIVFTQPADEDGDTRLATLAAHAPVTLAQILDYTPRFPTLNQGVLIGGRPADSAAGSAHAQGYIGNHKGLAKAKCVGSIGYIPDRDGTLRRIPMLTFYAGVEYLGLSQMLLACVNASDNPLQKIPADKEGLWRIPYSYAQESYTVISAKDLLHQRIPTELLKGRYVLIGSSALGLGDHVSTPLAPMTAGVMVHAAVLSGLLDLQQARIPWPTNGNTWLLLWCAITFGLLPWALSRMSALAGIALLLGQSLIWLTLAFIGVRRQIEFSVTAPLWGYGVFLLIAVPFEWWQSQRHGRQLLAMLSHYVAQPVLNEIVRRDFQYSLEPSLKDVTVLVADMEGYTKLTSTMPLQDSAQLTKDFLDCLTRPVLEHGGTLDKYSGDGLVAFWGAPLPCEKQADTAVDAALQILQEVQSLNERRVNLGKPPARVRIGIENGLALVGDLGTNFRSTYTAVGDCINFASRLEAAALRLGTPLLIGPKAAGKLFRDGIISLGQIHLRNTDTMIEVFTLKPLIIHSPSENISLK